MQTEPIKQLLVNTLQAVCDAQNPPRVPDLIARYLAYMQNQDLSDAHCSNVAYRLRTVTEACGMQELTDLSQETLAEYLATRRKAGLSIQTSNHYLAAMKAFGAWCETLGDDAVATNPFRFMHALNANKDRRHTRRAITREEFFRLLESVERGNRLHGGCSPSERLAIYHMAAMTGLRAGELGKLRCGDISENATCVVLRPEITKNGKSGSQPLPNGLQLRMKQWVCGSAPNTPLFPNFRANQAARMLRRDLADAGIDYEHAGEVFDFHSFRYYYASRLGESHAAPKVAQQLMRHANADLTMHYTQTDDQQRREAVERVESPPPQAYTAPELLPALDIGDLHDVINKLKQQWATLTQRERAAINALLED